MIVYIWVYFLKIIFNNFYIIIGSMFFIFLFFFGLNVFGLNRLKFIIFDLCRLDVFFRIKFKFLVGYRLVYVNFKIL